MFAPAPTFRALMTDTRPGEAQPNKPPTPKPLTPREREGIHFEYFQKNRFEYFQKLVCFWTCSHIPRIDDGHTTRRGHSSMYVAAIAMACHGGLGFGVWNLVFGAGFGIQGSGFRV
jgi:hypothetical protein